MITQQEMTASINYRNGGHCFINSKAKKLKSLTKMAAFVDNALKVFGTPERKLRRRWLHPFGIAPGIEETDDKKEDTQSAVSSSCVAPAFTQLRGGRELVN